MANIIFPTVKIFANGGEPTEERHVNHYNLTFKKNIMPFCFSHMLYLSLGTEVARETKKQATVTVIK